MKPQEEIELVECSSVTTESHVTIVWSDGSITIEHPLYQYEPDNPAYEHICLNLQERKAMYCALYGPPVLFGTA